MGAVLSGLIIPLITRIWQYRQKALEVKTALVSEISQAVMEFLMSIQFVHIRKEVRNRSKVSISSEQRAKEQTEFDQNYKAWEIKSAVIGTKLQAYLPKTEIPRAWTAFSEVVTRFYALEGIAETEIPQTITELARDISKTFSCKLSESANWMQMRESILEYKTKIISSILKGKIFLG